MLLFKQTWTLCLAIQDFTTVTLHYHPIMKNHHKKQSNTAQRFNRIADARLSANLDFAFEVEQIEDYRSLWSLLKKDDGDLNKINALKNRKGHAFESGLAERLVYVYFYINLLRNTFGPSNAGLFAIAFIVSYNTVKLAKREIRERLKHLESNTASSTTLGSFSGSSSSTSTGSHNDLLWSSVKGNTVDSTIKPIFQLATDFISFAVVAIGERRSADAIGERRSAGNLHRHLSTPDTDGDDGERRDAYREEIGEDTFVNSLNVLDFGDSDTFVDSSDTCHDVSRTYGEIHYAIASTDSYCVESTSYVLGGNAGSIHTRSSTMSGYPSHNVYSHERRSSTEWWSSTFTLERSVGMIDMDDRVANDGLVDRGANGGFVDRGANGGFVGNSCE